jgi:hypothetical protein
MRNQIVVSLVLASLGCSWLPPSVVQGGEVVANCAKEGVREAAKDALASVEFDLLQRDWKSLIANQVLKLGEETVACLIDHIVNQSRIDKMASADINARTKVERGEEWLLERRVRFKR